MPGKKYRSIQNPKQYEALKKKGFSKTSAARISNAATPGHHVDARNVGRPKPKKKKRPAKGQAAGGYLTTRTRRPH